MFKKKRKYSPRRVKQTVAYSTQEIAALYSIHIRTVHEWYRAGLPTIDDRKPFLVLGEDLKMFLNARQKSRKIPCQINELYCTKCRTPRMSWENQVDIRYLTEKIILVVGLCPICNTTLNKAASAKKLDELHKIYMIQTVHERNLIGSSNPIVNTDINKVEKL
jgi:hypothetical protein